ncbi:hypothetical protein J3R82DRAFT_25 [Butyriboletus roseoflavus]|nr:hypothetical protein J3R82DRAFT_25 [Butyriboletus roseoflavus]
MCSLTGIVFVQCVLYFKLYPGDFVWTKVLVFVVWAFDMMHTICIVTAVWESVITNFNNPQSMDMIPSALGLSVAVTAAITFMVHCDEKVVHRRSCGVPRIPSSSFCLHINQRDHPLKTVFFVHQAVSCGVTLSASVEFIITTIMVIFLGSRRTGFANMNHVINTMILYTLETGSVTCLVTIASLICWLIMRHNLIFLGMHFAIAKLYANSLLATLNMRKRLRVDRMYSSEREHNNMLTPLPTPLNKTHFSNRVLRPTATQKSLNVNVETTIVSQIDESKDHCDIEMATDASPTLAVFDQDGNYKVLDRESSDTT